jgi:hypothetical protein
MANKKGSYKVGFRKPPKLTRFKRGVSGNPNGRPKGAKNLNSVLAKELASKVAVTENGKQQKLPKIAVVAKRLVNKAVEGDARSIQTLIKHAEPQSIEAEAPSELKILAVLDTKEHHFVMADIVRRIQALGMTQSSRRRG